MARRSEIQWAGAWFFSGLPAIPSLAVPCCWAMAVRRAWGQPKPPQHLNLARRDSAKSHKLSRSLPLPAVLEPESTTLSAARRRESPVRTASTQRQAIPHWFRSLFLEAFFGLFPFTLAKTRHSITPAAPLFSLVTHGRLQRSCLCCIDKGEGGQVTWD
ncbi:hypothetical protein GGI42DRAFT_133196 [Trichoderma sp. SZMC 28013]